MIVPSPRTLIEEVLFSLQYRLKPYFSVLVIVGLIFLLWLRKFFFVREGKHNCSARRETVVASLRDCMQRGLQRTTNAATLQRVATSTTPTQVRHKSFLSRRRAALVATICSLLRDKTEKANKHMMSRSAC